jgi:hypothetical protein
MAEAERQELAAGRNGRTSGKFNDNPSPEASFAESVPGGK